MDPKEQIENVNSSAWVYMWKHYWWAVIVIIALGLITFSPILPIVLGMFLWAVTRGKVEQQFMKQLGVAIGYSYADSADLSTVTGRFFKIGDSQKISGVLSGLHNGSPARVFNFQYSTGSGKSRRTFYHSVFELALSTSVPEIFVSNYVSSWLASLTYHLGDLEPLKLEGDFSDKFSLFVAKGYEMEALEIFTPDIMVALIDKAKTNNLSFELAANKLYIYTDKLIQSRAEFENIRKLVEYLEDLFAKRTPEVNIVDNVSMPSL